MADRSPANHTQDRSKAPGGKSNAIFALKCVAPPQISHNIVPTTPIQNKTEIFPIVPMRRYSRITIRTTSPPEFALPCSGVNGYKYPAYFPKPLEAEPREKGACNNVCPTNKNEVNRTQ